MKFAGNWRLNLLVFMVSLALVGGTVAGPGLSWDEPAYRHSQITLQSWIGELSRASDVSDFLGLFDRDQIYHYWQYNRFGHNFHPPLAGLMNLVSYAILGGFWDEISARRFSSAVEFASLVTIVCHIMTRYRGPMVGIFSAISLLFMPRLIGDAHVIGTDLPMTLFWCAGAFCYWKARQSRVSQLILACLASALFLTKFSGVALAFPVAICFCLELFKKLSFAGTISWISKTLLFVVPLAILSIAVLFPSRPDTKPSALTPLADALIYHEHFWRWLFLVNPLTLLVFWLIGWAGPRSKAWPGAEIPWVLLSLVPMLCIAGNPTWWHDTLSSLSSYADLNLRRQGHLPDIAIFYLGQKYLYSLPWHNSFVLMGVTLPFGTLLLGALGAATTLLRTRPDGFAWYLFLQMMTLPLIRMLPTPAHDGVRLFLPTFVFFACFAGLGADFCMQKISSTTASARLCWIVLFLVGPIYSAWDWVRIHPFELSYYNIGLERAVDLGFEPTYWYDAVTPRVVEDLNARLPRDIHIGFPDRLINPEVFLCLQELGVLRADIQFDTAKAKTFPWFWLLTHSSKATAYTRLLYICEPFAEYGHDGVRLFSVVDPRASAVAWGLYSLLVKEDASAKGGPVRIDEAALKLNAQEVLALLNHLANQARNVPTPELSPKVLEVACGILANPRRSASMEELAIRDRQAFPAIARAIGTRKEDLRQVLESPGYLLPKRFHGYFSVNGEEKTLPSGR